jgi:AMP deaminase
LPKNEQLTYGADSTFSAAQPHGQDSGTNSPKLGALRHSDFDTLSEDDEEVHGLNYEAVEAGSEESWDEKQDKGEALLPEAALMPDDTPQTSTPSDMQDGMLPRDIQRKTAYYDYAAEKQLSQADAKLFYQRSQLEAQKTGGSTWGNSQSSPQGSPVLIPRSFSNVFESEQAGMRRSGSVKSMVSGHSMAQRFACSPMS